MSTTSQSQVESAGFAAASIPSHVGGDDTTQSCGQSLALVRYIDNDDANAVVIPQSAHTWLGFRDWALSDAFPQRGKYTFSSEGLIVDMSPESLETHNYIKADVGLVVHGLIRQQDLGRFLADRVLFSNESANISTEPDSMYIGGRTIQEGRCTLRESKRAGVNIEVLGSPDWILEVVSPTSIHKDKVLLREGYFRAHVGEYWIIDALGDDIDFQILTPGDTSFVAVESRDGWTNSPLFGKSFRLTSEVSKSGFLQYTLHAREKS